MKQKEKVTHFIINRWLVFQFSFSEWAETYLPENLLLGFLLQDIISIIVIVIMTSSNHTSLDHYYYYYYYYLYFIHPKIQFGGKDSHVLSCKMRA